VITGYSMLVDENSTVSSIETALNIARRKGNRSGFGLSG